MHPDHVANLAVAVLTGPETIRADSLFELVSVIAKTPEAHMREDFADAVLDRVFPYMPAYEAAKAARRGLILL